MVILVERPAGSGRRTLVLVEPRSGPSVVGKDGSAWLRDERLQGVAADRASASASARSGSSVPTPNHRQMLSSNLRASAVRLHACHPNQRGLANACRAVMNTICRSPACALASNPPSLQLGAAADEGAALRSRTDTASLAGLRLTTSGAPHLKHAGISRSVAMKLTGHKTKAVYRRFVIAAAGDLRDAGTTLVATLGTAATRTSHRDDSSDTSGPGALTMRHHRQTS